MFRKLNKKKMITLNKRNPRKRSKLKIPKSPNNLYNPKLSPRKTVKSNLNLKPSRLLSFPSKRSHLTIARPNKN